MRKIKFILLVLTMWSFFIMNAQTGTMQSPEAQSFEPIDATDMVNVNTGDFTYVMPLLNIPSPEGGYPITLAYHAGIAMDQDASWTGLGWNINPGAITRSINGYPDDWSAGEIREYFYDSGDSETSYSLSLGVTNIETSFSVGLSVSWADNRSTSINGYVGLPGGVVQLSGGTSGVGFGINIKGTPFSINVDSNGVGFSATLGGSGFDKNTKNGDTSYYASVSFSISSTWGGRVTPSIGFSAGVAKAKERSAENIAKGGGKFNFSKTGTSKSFSLETSITQSDYTVTTSGWFVPIIIPTPSDWLITGGFGKQTTEYHLNNEKLNKVSGPLYFNEAKNSIGHYEEEITVPGTWHNGATFNLQCNYEDDDCSWESPGDPNFSSSYDSSRGEWYCCRPIYNTVTLPRHWVSGNSFMDISEIGVISNSKKLELSKNNITLPNYDNYRVASQGMSGTFSPRMYKNGALIGLSKKINANQDFQANYALPEDGSPLLNYTDFSNKVNFFFNNEYSSSLIIDPVNFNVNNDITIIQDYIDQTTSSVTTHDRKKDGNFIESFFVSELKETSTDPLPQDFIKPFAGIDYSNADLFEQDGIGAFKITSPNGRTYHYSLPVYNHEIIGRNYGIVADRPNESQGFFEKKELKKFATTWLLTAITGSDYIDVNHNHLVDEEDYGYWVAFDYGKWSDAYIWYSPYNGEYREDESNPNSNIKSYNFGRKDIYYLDKIKTRTHTALFVKNKRYDANGKFKKYKHRWGIHSNTRTYNLQSQQVLKLDEIILVKNKDLENLPFSFNKSNVVDLGVNPNANQTQTITWKKKGGGVIKTSQLHYSLQNNVLDIKDLSTAHWDILKEKAEKIIQFNYSYELAQGTPYSASGRLTLKNIALKGHKGIQTLPNYKFSYNTNFDFDWDKKDDWGFYKGHPENWSLNEITTPNGGKIQVDYEADEYFAAFGHKILFILGNQRNSISHPDSDFIIESEDDFGIHVGDQLHVEYVGIIPPTPENAVDACEFVGTMVVVQDLGSNKYKLDFLSGNAPNCNINATNIELENATATYLLPHALSGAGIKVKEVRVTDDHDTFRTAYDYTNPITGESSGKVSYMPYLKSADTEVPYGAEMPAPIVMYENVKVTTFGTDGSSNGYSTYKFRVMHDKDENAIKFGDDFEITSTDIYNTSAVNIKKLQIKNNFAGLGQLLETSNYNNKNQLLYNLKNKYKTADEIYNAGTIQGVIQESFQSYKEVDYSNSRKWLINSSTKVSYPSVLKSTKITQGGYTSTTYFDKYSFDSGQLLETTTFDSDGNKFKTKTVPAYKKYAEMGSKVGHPNYKNMLHQSAANYTYLFNDITNQWDVMSASIQTWNNEWAYRDYTGDLEPQATGTDRIWRKYKSYIWQGEIDSKGVYIGYADDFEWGMGASQTNAKWKNVSTTTMYDHYSMPLEVEDINGNHAATKMGNNHTNVFASANAKYSNMYYSGAEDVVDGHPTWFSGEIKMDDNGTSINNTYAHTGKYAVHANAGNAPFIIEHLENGGMYKISVWVYNNGSNNYENTLVQRQGDNDVSYNPGEVVFAGDWVQLNYTFHLNNGQKAWIKNPSNAGYYDDFRLLPIASTMTSYVYDDWNQITYILGANNMAVKYEYTDAGELWRVYTEVANDTGVVGGFKLSNEYNMHYKENIGTNVLLGETLFSYTLSVDSHSTQYGTYMDESLDIDVDLTSINLATGTYTTKWFYKMPGENYVLLNPSSSVNQLHKHLSWSGQGHKYYNSNMKIICEVTYATGSLQIETPYLQLQCTVNGGSNSGSITGSN